MQPIKSTRMAWLVVGLLMPVALLNYLDRQMLATMQSSVMADISSIDTEEHWGVMLGQFKWVRKQLLQWTENGPDGRTKFDVRFTFLISFISPLLESLLIELKSGSTGNCFLTLTGAAVGCH